MEHGLLPEEEAHDAYKRMLKRKGKTAPAKKSGGGSASEAAAEDAESAKPKPKPKARPGRSERSTMTTTIATTSSPGDLKSNGGGSGFKIPKTEA